MRRKLTGDGDQVYPDVSGNLIAWEDDKTGDIAYYLWDKKWGKTYPRPGLQTSPVVSGKYIAYVDGTGTDTSIRKLDTSSWKDELVQAGPGQVKPSMDKRLVWLNAETGQAQVGACDLRPDERSVQSTGRSEPSRGGRQ